MNLESFAFMNEDPVDTRNLRVTIRNDADYPIQITIAGIPAQLTRFECELLSRIICEAKDRADWPRARMAAP